MYVCDRICKNRCNITDYIPTREINTHVLSRNTSYLAVNGQVFFHRRLYSNTLEPRGYTMGLLLALRGINRTPLGTGLLLMAS